METIAKYRERTYKWVDYLLVDISNREDDNAESRLIMPCILNATAKNILIS